MTDYFEYIDDYKSGSLPAELQVAFEKELTLNPKLKHAVENYDLLKKISASLIEDETREHLQKLKLTSNNPNSSTQKSRIISLGSNRKWIGIAASFLAIFASLFVIFSNQGKNSEEQYLAMQELPMPNDVRGMHDSTAIILDKAIDLFDDKQFDLAKPLFENNFQSDSLNSIAGFYLGHVYLKNKEYLQATTKFESLVNHRSYGFFAKYHLVICYLLQKDKVKANKYYNEIKNDRMLGEKQKKKFEKYLK